ncbi:MAG: AAC(3) family N-acetyltransferase [Clostridia bacterium]|nr:AAC(3) family N-acetyltransferase [Clostridia bacterium]
MTGRAERIRRDALALGVRPGDSILVHSSLRSLGEGFVPSDVTDGLRAALGDGGTLVFPALSYEYCGADDPFFDVKKTPSNVGAIPEYFRTSVQGVLRSINPTHSCCAVGKNARFLTEGHVADRTPCGENSPFRRLKELGGKILFIGCGIGPNTSMHAVEELVCPDYLFGDMIRYTVTDGEGRSFELSCLRHAFVNAVQRYKRLAPLLDGDALREGMIASADCFLVSTVEMWREAHKKLRSDPHYFVDIKN